MFTRSRYIHKPTPFASKHNGFSVELKPYDYPEDEPTGLVNIRYTICNKKDQFSKKQARIELSKKDFKLVAIYTLPEILAKLEAQMYFTKYQGYTNHWAWVWKYFL